VQRERVGWVANVNALIERVDTPYFCIVPHDDLIDRRYLAEVHALAASDPAIACAYSDIRGFGAKRPRISQPDIRGTTLTRILDFLLDHFSAVAFRGVVRRRDPDDRPYVPSLPSGDWAADTVWMLRIALHGELRRVPAALYAKRYALGSVHSAWMTKPRDELIELWAEHAAVCASIAVAHLNDPRERDLTLTASLLRVAGVGRVRSVSAAPRNAWEEDWGRVIARPDAALLRAALADSAGRARPLTAAQAVRRWLKSVLRQ
jgi:hypothetical protein